MKIKEVSSEEQQKYFADLKELGSRFTKDEWDFLSSDTLFQDMLFINIKAAERVALRLLTGE